MYGLLWKVLPGPVPVKILQCLVLIALAVAALFLWVFPWVEQQWGIGEVTVSHTSADHAAGVGARTR